MSFRAILHPKTGDYALEIVASQRSVEIKMAERSAATVTRLDAAELDSVIHALQAARAVMVADKAYG